MANLRAVCVFCGSSSPPDPVYTNQARELGRVVAQRGLELVYGGGQVGLMGLLADAAIEAGGRVTGVIPVGLFSREIGHPGLNQLHEVGSMHERKQLMYELADGFIALPGGLGTLEELAEVTTWSQLGIHRKPVTLLDVEGFWDPLVAQFDRMVEAGLLKAANRELVQRCHTPEGAIEFLSAWEPDRGEGYLDQAGR